MGKAYKIHRSRDRRRSGRGGKSVGTGRDSPSSESIQHSIPEAKSVSRGNSRSLSPRRDRGSYRSRGFPDRSHQSSRGTWKNDKYRDRPDNRFSDRRDRDRDHGPRNYRRDDLDNRRDDRGRDSRRDDRDHDRDRDSRRHDHSSR